MCSNPGSSWCGVTSNRPISQLAESMCFFVKMSWSMGSTMSDSWARGKSFVVLVVVIGFSVSRERLRSVGWGRQSLMQYEWLVCLVVYWHWLRQIHAKRPRPDRAVGVEDSAGQMNFSEIDVVSIYASLDGSAMRTKVWSQWMVHLPQILSAFCQISAKAKSIWYDFRNDGSHHGVYNNAGRYPTLGDRQMGAQCTEDQD